MHDADGERITVDPRQCGGRPCVRGTQILVQDVMQRLAIDASVDRLLAQFAGLTAADVAACVAFSERHAPSIDGLAPPGEAGSQAVIFEDPVSGDFFAVRRLECGPDETPGEGDLLLAVSARAGPFVGHDDAWVLGREWAAFLAQLKSVETSRRGSATVGSISPDEFELTIAIVDRAGHAAVRGHIARRHFGSVGETGRSRVCFDVAFDTSRLRELTDALIALHGAR